MLENAASDRPTRRSLIHKGATHTEALRINAATEKRGTRKAQALNAADMPPSIGAKPVGGPLSYWPQQPYADTSRLFLNP